MTWPLKIVILGLSLSSSWGNGHATTYRSLVRGLHEEGHEVIFLERDVPWYANNRDLAEPDFCSLSYYRSPQELLDRFATVMKQADAVIVGSFVPDGVEIIDAVAALNPNLLCFYDIDTPVTLAALDQGSEEYLARRQVPRFNVYFSFSGGRVLDRLEDQYGARRAVALYCSVDAERYRHTGERAKWDLGYLGTYSRDRQPTLLRLLLEPARQLSTMRFVVAGPQYPDDIDWPPNVERIEHLPPSGHASFYSRQRFTLNITRSDMIAAGWSPSVRLFEAGACQTAIISDFWEGLEELFPVNQAAIVARNSGDVVRALTSIPDIDRKALAQSAHTRVIANHTGRVRAQQLARALIEPNEVAAGISSRHHQEVNA
ncbi:CgeB family protein [Phyllobacterium endophyticum]|uniref:CgeB family protein n=1 Tax=Phyllobacterium endophyticum TaxID=1149773 RepID=UPI0011CA80C3|nr:glycosyltransferase [Phyllobacterium endophyticum]TXR47839.1 glycosyltransferase [Phyllobacterium endophyticum]